MLVCHLKNPEHVRFAAPAVLAVLLFGFLLMGTGSPAANARGAAAAGADVTGDVTAPAAAPYAASPSNFSPDNDKIEDKTTISATLSEAASVTLDIKTPSGTLVRRLLANSPKESGKFLVAWNGKNSSGAVVSDGTYKAELTMVDSAGNTGTASIDVQVNRTVSKVSTSRPYFSPNGDRILDGSNITYTLKRGANVDVNVYTARGGHVATLRNRWQNAGKYTVWWNGKTKNGQWAWTDTYKIKVVATNWAGTMKRSVTTIADKYRPRITGYNAGSVYPFTDGFKDFVALVFKASEKGTAEIKIWDPWGRLQLAKNLGSRNAGLQTWRWNGRNSSGVNMPAGTYSFRVTFTDRAGNTGKSVSKRVYVNSTVKKKAFRIGRIVIDLSSQTLTAYDTAGKQRFAILISSGRQGSSTPPGNYRVIYKKRVLIARSLTAYANWPSYFRKGFAIHGWPLSNGGRRLSGVLGSPASHGCVRVEDSYAKFIHDQTNAGSTIVTIKR